MPEKKFSFLLTFTPYRRYAALFVAWLGMLVCFRAFGGCFLADHSGVWQVPDPAWLRSDFRSTLLSWHAFPPLFLAYLGVVDFVSFRYAETLHAIAFSLLGLLSLGAMLWTLRELEVDERFSFWLTLSVLLTPSWWMYQHWLMYTFPVMALLSLFGLALIRALNTHHRRWIALTVILAVALVGTRAVFHWGWVLLAGTALLVLLKPSRNTTGLCVAVVLLAALALPLKNGLMLGTWSSSTFLGPNLYAMTDLVALPLKEEKQRSGVLSPVSRVRHFSALSFYPESYRSWQPRGVSVLDEPIRSDGTVNFNHGAYLRIHDAYLSDALRLMTEAPGDYARQVIKNIRRFGNPAWCYHGFSQQPQTIRGALAWSAGWTIGEAETFDAAATMVRTQPGWTWIHIPIAGLTVLAVWMMGAPGWWRLSREQHAFVLVAGITLLWVSAVAVTFMPVENYRLRFVLTPVYVCVAGLALQRLQISFITAFWETRPPIGHPHQNG